MYPSIRIFQGILQMLDGTKDTPIARNNLSRRGWIEVTMESTAFYVDFIWETDSTTNQRII